MHCSNNNKVKTHCDHEQLPVCLEWNKFLYRHTMSVIMDFHLYNAIRQHYKYIFAKQSVWVSVSRKFVCYWFYTLRVIQLKRHLEKQMHLNGKCECAMHIAKHTHTYYGRFPTGMWLAFQLRECAKIRNILFVNDLAPWSHTLFLYLSRCIPASLCWF